MWFIILNTYHFSLKEFVETKWSVSLTIKNTELIFKFISDPSKPPKNNSLIEELKGTLRRTSKAKPDPLNFIDNSNTEPKKVVSTINPKLFIIAKGNIAPRPKSPTDPGMKLSHPKRNFVINKFGTLPRNLTFQEQSFIKSEEDDNKSIKSDSSYISSEEQVTYASSQSSIVSSRNDIQSTQSLSNSPSVSTNQLSMERSSSEDEILNEKNGFTRGIHNFTKSPSPVQMIAPQAKKFIVPKPEKIEIVKSPIQTTFNRSISQDNIEVDGISNKYNFKRAESVRNGNSSTGLNISHKKRNFTVNGKSSQSPITIKSPQIFKTVQKIDFTPHHQVNGEEPTTPKVDKNFFRSLSLRKPKVPTEKPILTRQQSKTNEEMQNKTKCVSSHVMKMNENGQIVCEMEKYATKPPVPKSNKIFMNHGDVNFEKKACTSFSKDLAIEPNRYPDTVKVTKIVPQEKKIFNRNDPAEFQHLKFDVSSNGELTINKM